MLAKLQQVIVVVPDILHSMHSVVLFNVNALVNELHLFFYNELVLA